jgi:hypothetical protein
MKCDRDRESNNYDMQKQDVCHGPWVLFQNRSFDFDERALS